MKYTIFWKFSRYDNYEPMPDSELYDRIGKYENSYTNKRTALKDCNKLIRQAKAANALRSSEGSDEHKTTLYSVVDENYRDVKTGHSLLHIVAMWQVQVEGFPTLCYKEKENAQRFVRTMGVGELSELYLLLTGSPIYTEGCELSEIDYYNYLIEYCDTWDGMYERLKKYK